MGYTAPTTRASGYLVTAANWNTDLVDNISFLANPPSCRIYHSTTQSIAHNSLTSLTFDSERYDTDSMHAGGAPTRITFNTAGIYTISFSVELASAADYTRIMAAIRKNGATYLAINEVGTTTQVDTHRCAVSTVYKFAAADYIEAQVQHVNTAVAARNATNTGDYAPELAATWIGLG